MFAIFVDVDFVIVFESDQEKFETVENRTRVSEIVLRVHQSRKCGPENSINQIDISRIINVY